ncbi:MAG: DUF1003 domain-containing protein [Tepidiformaceae bacterium]
MGVTPAASAPPIASVVEENIRSLLAKQEAAQAARGIQDKTADWLTLFSGTMLFVYIHALWFVVWMAFNLGIFGLPAFDPFPFGLLTMIVSLESIFLSTFVLISQNRSAALADRRSDLDLHTNLLTEHELTRVLRITKAIAEHLSVDVQDEAVDVAELEQDVTPAEIADELDRQRGDSE